MWCQYTRAVLTTAALMLLCQGDELKVGTRNMCHDIHRRRVKTWAVNCRRLCHCRNNTNCNFRDLCPFGCENGWTRKFPGNSIAAPFAARLSRRASYPRNKYPIMNLNALRQKQGMKKKTKRKRVRRRRRLNIGQHSGWKRVLHQYRFAPSGQCVNGSNSTVEKRWTVRFTVPIFVRKVQVLFECKPLESERIFFFLRLHNQSSFSLSRQLTRTEPDETYSTALSPFVIADSVRIAAPQAGGDFQACKKMRIATVLLFGQPVCPYRKWGARCQKDCPCPCHVAECHPVRGHCFRRGYACPAAKYGVSCQENCSSSCGGHPPECHVISAVCKHCWNDSYTGTQCQALMTREEKEAKTAWCQRFTLQDDLQASSLNFKISNRTHHVSSRDKTMTIGITVIIVVVLFFVGCCIYIQLLRYCAKVRLVDHMAALDAERRHRMSMQSYSEFRREFYEMHGGKRPTVVATDKEITFRNTLSDLGIPVRSEIERPHQKKSVVINDPKLENR